MTDVDNDVERFEYYGPVSGFPLLVDRDNCKTATNDAERQQLEAEGYQAPSPGWPPFGWTTSIRPRNDSPDAICAWLDCQSKALCLLEQWRDAGDAALNSDDVNGNKQDATDTVRDAYLLVKVLKKKGWRTTLVEPLGRVSFRDARIELDIVLDWVQTAENPNRGTDKPTSRSDTPTKSRNSSKPRMLDAHCKACIKEFKEYGRIGEPRSMLDIVRDYVAQNEGVSETGLYRRLNDNSVHWKPKLG